MGTHPLPLCSVLIMAGRSVDRDIPGKNLPCLPLDGPAWPVMSIRCLTRPIQPKDPMRTKRQLPIITNGSDWNELGPIPCYSIRPCRYSTALWQSCQTDGDQRTLDQLFCLAWEHPEAMPMPKKEKHLFCIILIGPAPQLFWKLHIFSFSFDGFSFGWIIYVCTKYI